MIRQDGSFTSVSNSFLANFDRQYQGDLIKKIYSSINDSVVFTYEKNIPADQNLQHLVGMNVYNGNGDKIKTFNFNNNNLKTSKAYSYVTQPIGYPSTSQYKEINYRLYLDGFSEISGSGETQTYSFGYYGRGSDDVDPLPNRLSFAQDFGGYYNGKDDNISLIPTFDYVYPSMWPESVCARTDLIPMESSEIKIEGGDRNPNADYMLYGTIKSITYPTGGKVKYEFSPNKIPLTDDLLWRLKIDKISYYDSDGTCLKTKQYEYQESVLGRDIPKFYRYTFYNDNTGVLNLYPICINSEDVESVIAVELSPGPLDNIGLYEGALLGNTIVKEYESGNGYTIYNYSMNSNTETLAYPIDGMLSTIYGIYRQHYTFGVDFWPLDPIENNSWKNGLLLSQYHYDNNFKMVSGTRNYYSNIVTDQVPAIKIHCALAHGSLPLTPNKNEGLYLYSEFEYICFWNRLDSSITTTDGISTVSRMEYNDHKYLSANETLDSKGGKKRKEYIYPMDIHNGIYPSMAENNCVKNPVEIVEVADGKVVKSSQITYKEINDGYKPDKMFNLNISTPLSSFKYFDGTNRDGNYSSDPEISYDYFNSYGNPTQITTKDGITTSYYWSYNQVYPVVKAENINYSTLNSVISSIQSEFDLFIKTNIRDCTTDAQKNAWKIFNTSLRSNSLFKNAFISTYTYKPLVGMTSQTDPNGVTTYYEYDLFGRLKCIKDDDGRILKTYEYHYKQ